MTRTSASNSLTPIRSVSKATFDITSTTTAIAGVANKSIKVVAISMHNNDATSTNDTKVKFTDGSGGTNLYGGATGAIYLVGRGGFFGLPMSYLAPWFELTNGNGFFINPVDGKRVAGTVWYYYG